MTKKTTQESAKQKQTKNNALDSLNELFGYPDEDEEVLGHARSLMGFFIRKVKKRMEERNLSKEQLAERLNIPIDSLDDLLNKEIFPDWLTFCKLKMELEIPVHFHDF